MADPTPLAPMAVRPLLSTDLRRVAEIHCHAFPKSVLTELGSEAVSRYYRWLLEGPHDAFTVGCVLDGTLQGFLFGGQFNGAMIGFLRRNVPYLAYQVARRPALWHRAKLRHRVVIAMRLLIVHRRRQARRRNAHNASAPEMVTSFGVLSIGVDPSAQRQGVGRALMVAAEDAARACGTTNMHLTVQVANETAIRFYERLGWVRHGSSFNGSMRFRLRDPRGGSL